MRAEALILRPVRHGWSVGLTDGRELASFHGPGARARAEHYLSRLLQGQVGLRQSLRSRPIR